MTERVPISSLQVRDVIVFHRPDNPAELVVHRIISLKHVGDALVIKTQGDNNPVPDPWTVTLRGSTAYRAQFSLPLIGYAAIWWHQPQTRTIALWLAGLCALAALVVLAMPKRFRSKSSRDDAVNQDDPAGPTTAAGSEPSTASTTDAEPETQGGSSTAESLDMAGTSS